MLGTEVVRLPRLSPRSLALCALFATLIMVGAMIRIPLPYIPFTLQTLFVFLAGLVLGPVLGLLSAVLYMTAGLIGLPVFTGGGGLLYVFQPSFGYILSFCPAAYIIGYLAHRRQDASIAYLMRCCLAGLVVVYLIGVFYMGIILRWQLDRSISIWQLMVSGALVFLPGDVLSSFAASYLYRRLPPSVLSNRR